MAARIVERLAAPGPVRVTPVMARFLETVAAELPTTASPRSCGRSPRATATRRPALDDVCDPMYARTVRALIRDTLSPDVIHAGVKYNVIPGDAVIEVDCRVLPGHDRADDPCRAGAPHRAGPAAGLRRSSCSPGVRRSRSRPKDRCGTSSSRRCATTIPTRSRSRSWRPWATDAKSTAPLGVPTFGFSPLRLDPDERFLERFHGVDERVSLEALRFGLPVLYDVVRRFCG